MNRYRTYPAGSVNLFEAILGLVMGFVFVAVITAIFGLVAAIPIVLLWNWLVPTIFGLPTISYLQAWGLYWLLSLLFKGSISTNSSNK